MAAGVEALKKVKLPDCPGANGMSELFPHMMEFPLKVLIQLSEFPAALGLDGRLLPLNVQPYQKLWRLKVPVLCNVMV
jgi:hypothetical protein